MGAWGHYRPLGGGAFNGGLSRSVTLKPQMSPFLRSLSNWVRAVVLISVSVNDTVGIRIASGHTHARTDS